MTEIWITILDNEYVRQLYLNKFPYFARTSSEQAYKYNVCLHLQILSYPFIVLYVSIHNMFILLLIYMYLRAPWKIGYIQMCHPRKIKKLLTLLTLLKKKKRVC